MNRRSKYRIYSDKHRVRIKVFAPHVRRLFKNWTRQKGLFYFNVTFVIFFYLQKNTKIDGRLFVLRD